MLSILILSMACDLGGCLRLPGASASLSPPIAAELQADSRWFRLAIRSDPVVEHPRDFRRKPQAAADRHRLWVEVLDGNIDLELAPAAAATLATPRAGIGPWPYVALVGGNAADWVSTYRFQSIGRYEGNPLVGQNVWTMLGLKAGGTAFEAWLMRKMVSKGHPTAAKILGYTIGAVTGVIAIRNERFYRDRLRWNRAVANGTAVCDASGCRY